MTTPPPLGPPPRSWDTWQRGSPRFTTISRARNSTGESAELDAFWFFLFLVADLPFFYDMLAQLERLFINHESQERVVRRVRKE
jgi:hypothetical protein